MKNELETAKKLGFEDIPTRKKLYEEIESLKTENAILNSDLEGYAETIDELQKENAELKERLEKAVELPCKVGDKVVVIFEFEEEPVLEFGKVDSISVDESGIWINCFYESGLRYYHKHKDEKEIGLIFFGINAKAEAEKALKEKGE